MNNFINQFWIFSSVAIIGIVLHNTNPALALNTPAENGSPLYLTIGKAVNLAKSHNPEVKNAMEKINEVDAQIKSYVSALFPTLSASALALHKKDSVNGGSSIFGGDPYNAYSFSLSVSQPLFVGLGDWAMLSATRKDRQIRLYELEMAERNLTLTTISAFFGMVMYENWIELLSKSHQLQEKALATAQSRYKIGRGQLLDVLQIKTQLALLDSKIANAKTQRDIFTANVANLLGIMNQQQISIKGKLDFADKTPPIPKLQEIAKNTPKLPELLKSELLRDQFENKRQALQAKHWPQLYATANWGRSSFVKAELLDAYSTSWNFGLQLTIPLFSGLSSFYERSQLASQATQLEISQQQALDQVYLSQVKSLKQLESAHAQLQTTRIAAQYADEAFRQAEKDYRLQTTDYLQFLKSEQNFVDAQLQFSQAKYDLINTTAQYYSSMGIPLSGLIEILDPKEPLL